MESKWWGKVPFRDGERLWWEIGPLHLWIQRGPTDWHVQIERKDESLSTNLAIARPDHPAPENPTEIVRLGFRATSKELLLAPAPPDRPVVAKSESPFLVSPKEETTIFLSMPLWLQVRARRDGPPLYDVPTYRPSDTWFGADTLTGELGYALRTRALHELEGLPIRPHRAVCRVRIRNEAPTPLPLERLRLPAPHLGLYADQDGRFWTEGITLVRDADGDFAKLDLSRGAPKRAGTVEKIVAGRTPSGHKGLRIQSFGSLLGLGGS